MNIWICTPSSYPDYKLSELIKQLNTKTITL
jgi:hypothetical protein